MSRFKSFNHAKFRISYHIIFSVKFRRKLLEPIHDDLIASFHRAEHMQDKWRILLVETDNDHVHLFISATPFDSVTSIVHSLKQISTYDMWRLHHDHLQRFFWKEHLLWTRGYFCSSVGDVSEDQAIHRDTGIGGSSMPYFSYDNKRIYYEEHGKGNPVIFCHGNTSSSRMFSLLMPLYEKDLHCILIDFLGCGRSDRTASFPSDIWIDEARQVVCLVQHLELDEVSLIGTSGGAWMVMNAAMMMKGGVSSIIADSFDGRTLNSSFSSDLTKERESAM